MSEQHENIEHRVREALLAEASAAPAPPDLWERVRWRLERPSMPSAGWQRRWRLVAAGAAAAVVLVMGGAGTALLATGLTSGTDNEPRLARVDAPEGHWGPSGEDASIAFAAEPGLSADNTETPRPEPASEDTKTLVAIQPSSGELQGLAGERQIISQASLDLEVNDVNAAAIQLRGLAESFGGFIEHISTSGGPNPEYGSAVVRVPGDRFLDALDSIERLGKAVGQSLGQRDVTGEVIDLEARLKSERSAEQSLLKLLDRAVSVSDVLTVERELTRVRADIERLQGQLEFIQRSVALATITVSFVLPPGSVPAAPSASLQVEVDDVERSVTRIQELVGSVDGIIGQVSITTRQDSQEAFLSFRVPASALDSVLTSVARDGVVLHREVQRDGGVRQDVRDDDLYARVTVQLQTPEHAGLWRSIGVPVAGGLLLLLSVAGALALVLRARRRRA